jgi:hypothetical protein
MSRRTTALDAVCARHEPHARRNQHSVQEVMHDMIDAKKEERDF